MSIIQSGKNITVIVTAAEVGESKKKSTPGVLLSFKNDEGTIDGSLWLTSGALKRSLNTLRECFGFNDDFATLPEQCIGKQCVITVEDEADDKGKFWPRVKWINAIRTANKPAAGELLARLSAQAKGIARPADAPKPNPKVTPKPAPAPAAAPVADDECPY